MPPSRWLDPLAVHLHAIQALHLELLAALPLPRTLQYAQAIFETQWRMHQLQADLPMPDTPNSLAQGYYSTPWGDSNVDNMTAMGSTDTQPRANTRAMGAMQLQLGEVHPGIPGERRSVDWWTLQEEPQDHQNPQETEEPSTTSAERAQQETQAAGPEQHEDREAAQGEPVRAPQQEV